MVCLPCKKDKYHMTDEARMFSTKIPGLLVVNPIAVEVLVDCCTTNWSPNVTFKHMVAAVESTHVSIRWLLDHVLDMVTKFGTVTAAVALRKQQTLA
jgi:hypothetical protein